jgi:hypothetical protein
MFLVCLVISSVKNRRIYGIRQATVGEELAKFSYATGRSFLVITLYPAAEIEYVNVGREFSGRQPTSGSGFSMVGPRYPYFLLVSTIL